MKCSNNTCSNKAKYRIKAVSEYTGSILLGKVCQNCLPEALKVGYKVLSEIPTS